MRLVRWLLDYWHIPVFAIGAYLIGMFAKSRYGRPPIKGPELLQTELASIDAKREARRVAELLGREKAIQQTQARYAATRKRLDETAKAKLRGLGNDPEALAQELERLSRRRPGKFPL